MSSNAKHVLSGLIFAVLWGSASTATKIALHYAQPFTISVYRFFLAAGILIFIAHVIMKEPFPSRYEWKHLLIYGLLNIALYLGLFIVGMQFVSAGIASLFIATNSVFISIMAAVWIKHALRLATVMSLLVCSAGILVAAYPMLQTSHVTIPGLLIILLSMVCYSVASVYFTRQSWSGMHILTINGWQTMFGAIFTVPFFLIFYREEKNILSLPLAGAVIWLAVPVSIGAVQLWMYLLKKQPVRASFWLFLCPIFGILIAAAFLREPVSVYTLAGVSIVLAGLFISQRIKDVPSE